MSSHSSDFLDLWHLASIGKQISGTIPLAKMLRLADQLEEKGGEADYSLLFSKDEKQRPCIRGEINARLVLLCQRCLERLEVEVSAPISLVVVESVEEGTQLAGEMDPLLLGQRSLRSVDLVEEELLLALPQVPMHKAEDCTVIRRTHSCMQGTGIENRDGGDGPLSMLAELISKKKRE